MQPTNSEQPPVLSHREASNIAREVRSLIKAGEEAIAWERLRSLHPADMGSIIASLPRSSRDTIVRIVEPETLTWMFRQMNPLQAGRVAAHLGSQLISGVLDQVNPRNAMHTLLKMRLPQAREVSGNLELEVAEREAFQYATGTAGALMVPEYPFVSLDETVAEALANLRDMGSLRYEFSRVYVVDGNGGLAGQISVVDLALSLEQARIRDILGPVAATVTPDTPAAECARLRRHYNIMQLPVVWEGALIGVIPAEFLLSAVVEEDTRQMLNVGAVSGDSGETSMVSAIRTRLPWLTVNLGTTFLAAATISLFESTLAQVVILAAFLPVVAGQGGIGGTQTLTMIVRSIALGEFVGVSAWRLLTREALLGVLHGVWLGVLVGVIALLWTRNPALGMVLGLAMLGNMVIAGVAGAGVPLFLRRIGIDPAVASAVVVTTFTDVFGFLLFLGIASAAISLLV
ncbi:MAG: magnesium transporter [Chloroflexota bacterium]|nr:magnesium transporter [Chloroflexota bacterium]